MGGSAGAGSWKCWPEASATRIGARRGGSSMTSGRAGGGAAAAAGNSPGPGSGIKAASSHDGALGSGRVIILYGGGAGHPRPSPARSQSNCPVLLPRALEEGRDQLFRFGGRRELLLSC